MKRLYYSLYKEYKVLVRDKAAMAVTFIMPMVLVFVVTLIQDTTFKSVSESDIPLLLVDQDKDSLGKKLESALLQSKFFSIEKKDISSEDAKQQVASGKYLVAIVVPKNTTKDLREKAEARISKLFTPGDSIKTDTAMLHLHMYFDPITKQTFKTIISTSVDRIVSGLEMQSMVSVLNDQLKENFADAEPEGFEAKPLVTTDQEYATNSETKIIPNSVQHNVPAWTMFAMFFICIPLSGNIIKEREDGSAFRLLTMPGSYMNVILGKVLLYLLVSLIQFVLMLSVGFYFLPMIGLPQLQMGNSFITLLTIAISSGLAATGFGLLIGTIANSQDQAALFGAIFVVIMAAIGGVWIPTFVMPDVMKKLSAVSPLNWGLEAFYGVFLRGASLGEIFIHVFKLLLFFMACVGGAFYYQVYRRMR
jgi:ABC-2 type transport system permease protein